MKKFFLLIIISCAFSIIKAQNKTYFKYLDVNQNTHEFIFGKAVKQGDDIIIRLNNAKVNNDTFSTTLVKYDIKLDTITSSKYLKDIRGGLSILVGENQLILPSQNEPDFDVITVSAIDSKTLQLDTTIQLKLPEAKYDPYYISKSIVFNDKYFIGAHIANNEKHIGYNGWNQFQGVATFFVLNKNLSVDTTLIFPPFEDGAFLKINDLTIGADSILYVTFYERYIITGPATKALNSRKVIYGIDKSYKVVSKWYGINTTFDDTKESKLVIDKNNTKYFNFIEGIFHYMLALNPDNSIKWQGIIDTLYYHKISLASLKMTNDGNLILVGYKDSPEEKIGRSAYAVKINSTTGKVMWKRVFRANNNHLYTGTIDFIKQWQPIETGLLDIEELPNGDFMMIGNVSEYDVRAIPKKEYPYNHKMLMIKTNSEGCLYKDCAYIQDIISKTNYLPFVSAKNEWIIQNDGSIINPAKEFERRSFSTDSTLVNGKYYRNLIYSYKETGTLDLKGALMREEQGKIYVYDDKQNKEFLIYNMNYNIGDIIPANPQFNLASATVINVGTILLKDDIPRKFYTYSFDSCKQQVTIVEGMGDYFGGDIAKLNCGTWSAGLNTLRCFSTNAQQLYKAPNVDKCFPTLSADDLSFDNFKVFPNPSNGELSFNYNLENASNCEWKLYDNLGILKYSFKLNNSENQETINLDFLNNGIYHWQLVNEKKVISNGKVFLLK